MESKFWLEWYTNGLQTISGARRNVLLDDVMAPEEWSRAIRAIDNVERYVAGRLAYWRGVIFEAAREPR